MQKIFKYILIVFVFCATVAQGITFESIQDIVFGADIILVMDLPLLLLYFFGRKRLAPSPLAKVSMVLTYAFFAWSAIGLFFAPNLPLLNQELVMNIRTLLIFLALINFVNSKQDVQYLFLGFALGLFFQGFVAIHQWLRGPVGLAFLGEQPGDWQARGTFVHPSVAGLYFSLMSIFVFRMAVYLRPRFHPLYVIAFFFGVIALYATFNRANWLGFAGAMVIMFAFDFFRGKALTRKARGLLALMAVVAVIGTIRYGTTIVERFSDSEESMLSDRSSSRKSLALDAIRIIKDHPFTGVGLNNYKEYVNKETAGLQIVHCTYLLVTAELGFPGGLLFVALLFSFIYVGFKTRSTKDPFIYHVASAGLTAVIAFAIAMLPSPDYRNLYVKIHIWIAFAVVLIAAKMDYNLRRMLADPRIRAQLAARKKALMEQQAAQRLSQGYGA
ncbi:MAG TPA: O-antigen ligase family protein [bacterium]|nr:O-antigen ligase family protein [bacterium]HQI49314.1 O-antigen ligase family protein [bacterium]HQJ64273.1 O-antigen ligase family protein [bacterium]